MKSQHNVELYDFIIDYKKYRSSLGSSKNQLELGNKIIRTYISKNQINISGEARVDTLNLYKKSKENYKNKKTKLLPTSLFDKAFKEVKHLISASIFPGFQKEIANLLKTDTSVLKKYKPILTIEPLSPKKKPNKITNKK